MAFIIGLPVAQIILFCLAIGHDPTGLPIAVSNHELSESLLAQQECPLYDGCNYTLLSCRYLEFLKNRSVVTVSLNAHFVLICMLMSLCLLLVRPISVPTMKPSSMFAEVGRGER